MVSQWSLYVYIVLSSESNENNFNFLGEHIGSLVRFDSEVVGSALCYFVHIREHYSFL
jgi:hypothetical protein